MTASVWVLDFGAQYNQLIARRIREAEIFCEVVPGTVALETIRQKAPAALVLSGGPESVFAPDAPRVDREIFELGIPILGICYGMQLMAATLGGVVSPAAHPEYGRHEMRQTAACELLAGIPQRSPVWMSHGDVVNAPPPGFTVYGVTERTPNVVMGNPEKRQWAVQFHPEVHHTPHGMQILKNFLHHVARLTPNWKPSAFIPDTIDEIRRRVGDGRALIALSGGVDSAVAAAIAERALGERLTAVLIDHGLMRAGEVEEVVRAFPHLDLQVEDASRQFMTALNGVVDPEAKRKIIGREFVDAFERVAGRLGQIDFLIQGTVYPDVIESGGQGARTIKSHHNVGGLPENLRFSVVEPLKWLFKDEVRRVGAELGLPEAVVWRQPFPGPGLAVRIVGEVTVESVERVRAADRVVREEIARAGLGRRIWQAFAVLLDIRSVGVMGDGRTYGQPVVVRVVESEDGMTADWVDLPRVTLDAIAQRIVSEVEGVNRVTLDITSKPPGTIEWE